MDSLKFIECVKALGLTGQDLLDYAEKENDFGNREERLIQREDKRMDSEREEKRLKVEHENNFKRLQMESEMKLEELRLESLRLSKQATISSSENSIPRLPCFKENECDI